MRANAMERQDHIGSGLRISRIVNGVPTIVTNKQLEARMQVLEDFEKRGDRSGLLKIKALYKEALVAIKQKNEKNMIAIKHCTNLIAATDRILKGEA